MHISPDDQNEVFHKQLHKITSTMTDRAANMKSFDRKLEKFLELDLGNNIKIQFLHCNAHCLLSFSTAIGGQNVESWGKAYSYQQNNKK